MQGVAAFHASRTPLRHAHACTQCGRRTVPVPLDWLGVEGGDDVEVLPQAVEQPPRQHDLVTHLQRAHRACRKKDDLTVRCCNKIGTGRRKDDLSEMLHKAGTGQVHQLQWCGSQLVLQHVMWLAGCARDEHWVGRVTGLAVACDAACCSPLATSLGHQHVGMAPHPLARLLQWTDGAAPASHRSGTPTAQA